MKLTLTPIASCLIFLTLITVAAVFSVSAYSDTTVPKSLVPQGGLTVTLNDAGGYSVISHDPDWTFQGSVHSPITNLEYSNGKDLIGPYQEASFQWTDGTPFVGSIRDYSRQDVVQFFIKSTSQIHGATPDFPEFDSFPTQLHHLSFEDSNFTPAVFGLDRTSTPWLLFDDSKNTAVLSPSSDFIVSQMHGDGNSVISSGLLSTLTTLPAGFTHSTLFVVGKGIESTFHKWGGALTAISGKQMPQDDNDPMLKYFGYWTDNGAYYYYNYDLSKGYAGTILAINDEFKKINIPLHYMQLDSWWYQKSRVSPDGQLGGPKNASLPEGTWNAYGGTLDYSASPQLFPAGLASFHDQLGLPIVVHGRWIDPSSPYHAQYKISGIAPIDANYWNDRAKYLADNGVFCYEQDWLVDIYAHSPDMATNLEVGNDFTDNMASATKANHETMQYCMATARFFLQGSKYSNLTTIRTSDDRFRQSQWNHFIYTSALADSLHVRPWADVFMSTETGNLLLSTLSAGPVGVGDEIGTESASNILKSIRPDGVIIKPDAPLLPTDETILNDVKRAHLPLVASTFTNTGVKTGYVFAYARSGDSSNVSFTPSSLGLDGTVYIEKFDGTAVKQNASETFTDTLGTSHWNYYRIASVGRSGIAYLGDSDKFVGTGRARVSTIKDSSGGLTSVVTYVKGQDSIINLSGYSAAAPGVKITGAVAAPVNFDSTTGRFTVAVTVPPSSTPATASPDTTSTFTIVLSER